MEFLDKGKTFIKQFTEGVVESPAFNHTIRTNQFVVKANAVPTAKQTNVNSYKMDSKSKKYKAISKNNSKKAKCNAPERYL